MSERAVGGGQPRARAGRSPGKQRQGNEPPSGSPNGLHS